MAVAISWVVARAGKLLLSVEGFCLTTTRWIMSHTLPGRLLSELRPLGRLRGVGLVVSISTCEGLGWDGWTANNDSFNSIIFSRICRGRASSERSIVTSPELKIPAGRCDGFAG
jgi:hypothetical protein